MPLTGPEVKSNCQPHSAMNLAYYNSDFPATNPYWHDSGINALSVTSHFLIGSKAHYRRRNPDIPDAVNEAKNLWLNHS